MYNRGNKEIFVFLFGSHHIEFGMVGVAVAAAATAEKKRATQRDDILMRQFL